MITLWCAALIKMRFSTSSLLTTIIVFSVFYIFSEYRESKQNKSSLASMKVVDKDNIITPRDSYSDDIYAYKSWSKEKINNFLQIKAAQYEQRRARVSQYCNLQVEYENMILIYFYSDCCFSWKESTFSRKRYTLIYNHVDNLAYCPIAKVASSTWCGHFLRMGNSFIFSK